MEPSSSIDLSSPIPSSLPFNVASTATFARLFSFQDFYCGRPEEGGDWEDGLLASSDDEDDDGLPAFMRHPGAAIGRKAERAAAKLDALEAGEVVPDGSDDAALRRFARVPLAHRDVVWAMARAAVALEMEFALASDVCIAPPEFRGLAPERSRAHTYGEITCDAVDTIARVFFGNDLGGAAGAVVVDLGSGIGKVPLQLAFLARGAAETVGVELARGRHNVAEAALAAIRDHPTRAARLCCPVRYVCGDVTDDHYSTATHAFGNTLLFDDELKQLTAARIEACPDLKLLVTTTPLPLSPTLWKLRDERLQLSVSWDASAGWEGFVWDRTEEVVEAGEVGCAAAECAAPSLD